MENKIKQQNIPNGWETLTFKDLSISVIDGDRGVNYPNHNDFLNQGHCLFLNAGNVTKNGFKFSEVSFITEQKDKEMGKGKLSKDDLVITTRGTIGNIAHYSEQIPYENIRINSGMAIIRNSKEKINTNFLSQYFSSSLFSKELKRVAFGSAQPQLTIQIISKFEIKIPEDKSEQARIVSVLKTWDQVIEKLKRKIEVKKEIKKGLVQELLTGKTRLAGFNQSWESEKIEDICQLNPNDRNLPDTFIYIDLESVEKGKLLRERVINLADAPSRAQRLLQYGDILFQTVRPYQKNNLLFKKRGSYVASTGYAQLRAKGSPEFIYHILHTDEFVSKVLEKCTGSNYPAINSGDLGTIKVKIPKSPEEQIAIAEVLEVADAEINLLEQKLSFLKDQKKYLLNNLVTGTIRTPKSLSIPK